MEAYNPDYDYLTEYLIWLNDDKQRNYRPRWYLTQITENWATYKSYIEYLFLSPQALSDEVDKNKLAYLYYKDDVKEKNPFLKKDINKKAMELFGIQVDNSKSFLVTFNYPPDLEYFIKNKNKILNSLQQLFNLKWIDSAKATFEYYCKDGNHPHIHILIKTSHSKNKMISKFKEKILRTPLAKTLTAPNYCDIRYANSNTDNYVEGNKQLKKMENCEKDKLFRKQYNLEEIYQCVNT